MSRRRLYAGLPRGKIPPGLTPYGQWQFVRGVPTPAQRIASGRPPLSEDAPAAASKFRSPSAWDLAAIVGVYPQSGLTFSAEIPLVGDISAGPFGIGTLTPGGTSAPNVPNIGKVPTGFRGVIDSIVIRYYDSFGNDLGSSSLGDGQFQAGGSFYLTGLYAVTFYVNNTPHETPRRLAGDSWGVMAPHPHLWLETNDAFLLTMRQNALTVAANPTMPSYDGVNIINPVYSVGCRVQGRWVPDDAT